VDGERSTETMSSPWLTIVCILLGLFVVLPFVVSRNVRIAAYSWQWGKQQFQKETENGESKAEEERSEESIG